MRQMGCVSCPSSALLDATLARIVDDSVGFIDLGEPDRASLHNWLQALKLVNMVSKLFDSCRFLFLNIP